jgi:PAS domain S-box-containing protein
MDKMLQDEINKAQSFVNWSDEFCGAITVCDKQGIIVYMNEQAIAQFVNYGGEKLLGSNLLDCHPEPSKSKIEEMLKKPVSNMYTAEKDGQKKIIYQSPWMQNCEFAGIIEISLELSPDMPHFKR